jgi:hypothetical protein
MASFDETNGVRTEAFRSTISEQSSATFFASSCLKTWPTIGWAGMKMPALAPSTPASHEPSVDTTTPSSSSFVSSPKYQTLPAASWANQSNVSSTSSLLTNTWSCTTVVVTPRISLVSLVTENTSVAEFPSTFPL